MQYKYKIVKFMKLKNKNFLQNKMQLLTFLAFIKLIKEYYNNEMFKIKFKQMITNILRKIEDLLELAFIKIVLDSNFFR